MKAKDTLLTGEQRIAIYKEYMAEQPDGIEPECEFAYLQKMLKTQADSTWKAREPEIEEARRAGIQEVVEFVHQMWIHDYGYPMIDRTDWQRKLKEWGIE